MVRFVPSISEGFAGLEEYYQDSRPNYPDEVFAKIRECIKPIKEQGLAADVGAGTGMASRPLALAFPEYTVIGFDPAFGMLERACMHSRSIPNLAYIAACAESLPLADSSADLVIAAQALHWFDRDRFYKEVERVLAPRGVVAILFNNPRNATSPLLQEVENALRKRIRGYNPDYRPMDIRSELGTRFDPMQSLAWNWDRSTSIEQFVMYFSLSLMRGFLHAGNGGSPNERLDRLSRTKACSR